MPYICKRTWRVLIQTTSFFFLLRLTRPLQSAFFFFFFWSIYARSGRGWNNCPFKPSGWERERSHHMVGEDHLIRGNILGGESTHWTGPPTSRRPLQCPNQPNSKRGTLIIIPFALSCSVSLSLTCTWTHTHETVNLSLNRPPRNESSMRRVLACPLSPRYSYIFHFPICLT